MTATVTPLPKTEPGFDRPPLVLIHDDGVNFEVWDEVVYTGTHFDCWTIPAGFTTDFATIPSVVSWAVPKLGAYTLAAIVHDLLCEGLNDWEAACLAANGDRTLALRISDFPTANAVDTDAIFYKIARDYGTDPITARLLWAGVRWGALANPARRSGWLKTAPAVLGWSLLFSPVLVPATVVVGVAQGILWSIRKLRSLL